MTKIFLIIFTLFSLPAWALRKAPDSKNGTERGFDLRILKKSGPFILVTETKNRDEILDQKYQQFLLGTYLRLSKNLRAGLFFQGEKGLRWDSDWKKDTIWEWQNLQNRWDFSSILDVTYTNFLFKNTLWEWKNRINYYHSRDALLLKTRPGIRHFIMKFGKPLWQIYYELEAYLPVNYGESILYEYWLYSGALYQVTDEFSIGPLISYRQRWYHSYSSFESKTSQNYKETFSSIYFGLSALYSF